MRQGGSYVVTEPGAEPTLVERTVDHPEGNRARDAQGRPIEKPAQGATEPPAAPAPAKRARAKE